MSQESIRPEEVGELKTTLIGQIMLMTQEPREQMSPFDPEESVAKKALYADVWKPFGKELIRIRDQSQDLPLFLDNLKPSGTLEALEEYSAMRLAWAHIAMDALPPEAFETVKRYNKFVPWREGENPPPDPTSEEIKKATRDKARRNEGIGQLEAITLLTSAADFGQQQLHLFGENLEIYLLNSPLLAITLAMLHDDTEGIVLKKYLGKDSPTPATASIRGIFTKRTHAIAFEHFKEGPYSGGNIIYDSPPKRDKSSLAPQTPTFRCPLLQKGTGGIFGITTFWNDLVHIMKKTGGLDRPIPATPNATAQSTLYVSANRVHS